MTDTLERPGNSASDAQNSDEHVPAHRSSGTSPTPAARPVSEFSTIPEMVDRVAAGALEKASHPLSHFVRSLIGGVFVAFGVLLSLTVATGVSTPGLKSLVMGLAFGMSFVLILVSGVSLITADMAAGLILLLRRQIGVGAYGRFLGLGLVGNLLGTLFFVTVAALAGGPYLAKPFTEQALKVGVAKSGEGTFSAILLAVLCTWFLQTAMFMFFKARNEGTRMAFAFYGPFAFVVGGTQHVIANIGFIGFPWLLHAFHPDAAPATPITWDFGDHGMLRNLATTTLGNFIGGALLVALPFYIVSRLMQRER
ncbi:formate/nitrite transporter family protein [Dermacoccus abyssi]|jgi:formate/nitrite transporter FocA (FNT family)|uniref:Formate/nitrite transporter family protein n=1 Tax=Dermacoccus abyssi TaxID=322596 RepID=A0ABX5Z7D1_9MICO|nr:formate/nitrite transporter family protein [Dermacoccus abyssi]